ncbi:hypothetical protein [Sulfurospirillum sp. 1612]|uniref:hypothetical protein n=1 Tax=Sulfurospirillum sp. 1612 TaxID=3094835 RepID=UPI002F93F890
MMDTDVLLEDALLLVEQNFYFLNMGEFLGKIAKTENLSERSLFVVKKCSEGQAYYFNAEIIYELLENAREYKNEEMSFFEYFVEFNAFRGICMAMVESLRLESPFQDYIKDKMQDQYENFFDILSFIRNVLSHNTHAEIRLNDKDFDGTLKRIRRMRRNEKVTLSFRYSETLPEISPPNSQYGLDIGIDFLSLKKGDAFLDVVTLWDLFMIGELCFNLVISYRAIYNQ